MEVHKIDVYDYVLVCTHIVFYTNGPKIMFLPASELWWLLWDVSVWFWVKGLQVRGASLKGPFLRGSLSEGHGHGDLDLHTPSAPGQASSCGHMYSNSINGPLAVEPPDDRCNCVYSMDSKNRLEKERVSCAALWGACNKMFTPFRQHGFHIMSCDNCIEQLENSASPLDPNGQLTFS